MRRWTRLGPQADEGNDDDQRDHGTGRAQLAVRWGADNVVVETTNPVAPGAATRPGHCVEGMRQRAALSGGTVTAAATPAGTWTTTARIPLNS